MSSVLGGHIDAIFGNPSEILPQLEAGELRALAVSTGERLESLPDVPTFKEQGYDIQHSQIRAIVMPPNVPEEALAFWQDALQQLAESDLWKQEYIQRYNMAPTYLAGDELKARFDELTASFEKQMRKAGLIE